MPLRVGVLVDSLAVPNWVAHILAQIVAAPFLDLVLVVVNAEETETQGRFRTRARRFARQGLYSLYHRFDFERRRRPGDAFDPVDVSAIVDNAKVLRVMPLRPRPHEHRFDPTTIERINAEKLDVLLRFGFAIIRGEILDSARYGVWSFHHGDNREYRGGPALFWEIYEGNPLSGTMLQILTEDLDGGKVIYRSWSATDPVSLYRNQNDTYWKTASFIVRRLKHLHDRGFSYITSLPTYSEKIEYERRIYRLPRNGQMLVFFAKLVVRLARRRVQSWFLRGQWFLAYGEVGSSEQIGELQNLTKIKPPRKRYFADPFVTAWQGRQIVFFEDYSHKSGKGSISYVEIFPKGHSEPRAALSEPHHLSYPFTFEHGGRLFMIPESSANRTVELYRAEQFPDRWISERVLMEDVDALDPTLLVHDGRFWLFMNMVEGAGRVEDELFLFSAESLEGPWAPHPLNPIVSDVRSARPAGRIVQDGGRLIRPAQDSGRRYGGAIVLNEIEVLTEDDYREKPVGRIEATWSRRVRATHCWTTDGKCQVIDGFRYRLKLPWT